MVGPTSKVLDLADPGKVVFFWVICWGIIDRCDVYIYINMYACITCVYIYIYVDTCILSIFVRMTQYYINLNHEN